MTIDLVLLALVLFFALLGALSGAARQIANAVALCAGYFAARVLGGLLGARVAEELGTSLMVGSLVATVGGFAVTYLLARYVLTQLLLRVFAGGGGPESRGFDRGLGFLLGGLKVAVIAYVLLSALSFLERNVTIAGKKLGFAPRHSRAFALAREHNFFEYTQAASAREPQPRPAGAAPAPAARLRPPRTGAPQRPPARRQAEAPAKR